MAFVAPILMAASTAVGVASAIQQGRVARAQAKAQSQMEEYNRDAAERDARAAEAKTRFDQIRQQQYGRRVMGRLKAKLGASGALTSEGAPLMLLASQAAELALENALIGVEGRTQAGRYRSQATLYGMQRDIYKMQGRSAQQASYLQAGKSLLSGFTAGRQQGAW